MEGPVMNGIRAIGNSSFADIIDMMMMMIIFHGSVPLTCCLTDQEANQPDNHK